MADKYGPIFTVKMGVHQALVARKIARLELLSNHRLEKLKHVREYEMRTSVKELYDVWSKNKSSGSNKVLVDMKRWFGDAPLTCAAVFEVVGYWRGREINEKDSQKFRYCCSRMVGRAQEDEDFMDVMITILQDDPQLFPGCDADAVYKATCLVCFS
ncbi:hypothetical protein QYF36_008491 [Acer negundo]|nr:hypothetical protein QYF36_008491 [Acer negundo]